MLQAPGIGTDAREGLIAEQSTVLIGRAETVVMVSHSCSVTSRHAPVLVVLAVQYHGLWSVLRVSIGLMCRLAIWNFSLTEPFDWSTRIRRESHKVPLQL